MNILKGMLHFVPVSVATPVRINTKSVQKMRHIFFWNEKHVQAILMDTLLDLHERLNRENEHGDVLGAIEEVENDLREMGWHT